MDCDQIAVSTLLGPEKAPATETSSEHVDTMPHHNLHTHTRAPDSCYMYTYMYMYMYVECKAIHTSPCYISYTCNELGFVPSLKPEGVLYAVWRSLLESRWWRMNDDSC